MIGRLFSIKGILAWLSLLQCSHWIIVVPPTALSKSLVMASHQSISGANSDSSTHDSLNALPAAQMRLLSSTEQAATSSRGYEIVRSQTQLLVTSNTPPSPNMTSDLDVENLLHEMQQSGLYNLLRQAGNVARADINNCTCYPYRQWSYVHISSIQESRVVPENSSESTGTSNLSANEALVILSTSRMRLVSETNNVRSNSHGCAVVYIQVQVEIMHPSGMLVSTYIAGEITFGNYPDPDELPWL